MIHMGKSVSSERLRVLGHDYNSSIPLRPFSSVQAAQSYCKNEGISPFGTPVIKPELVQRVIEKAACSYLNSQNAKSQPIC